MEKYILTKTQKGKKYLYEVKGENGNVVSKRTSTRDYVACSVSGEFYFGRLDLVGNGDCPECGGDMEVTDGEYRRTGGDGYITPPEYSPIWEEKTCRNCGYKESNKLIY